MIKVAISGCCGRMGLLIGAAAKLMPGVEIGGTVEKVGHEKCGTDIGLLLDGTASSIITDDMSNAMKESDCLIEFTSPEATMAHLNIVRALKKSMVIGTTALSDENKRVIAEAAQDIPIVFSPNMSVGVTMLFEITAEVARRLGSSYDIEIIEYHHRAKKDAPSGTAQRLAEIAAAARQLDLADSAVYGRQGMVGPRGDAEIGVHAVRGGDIVGEHTVMFAGNGERIELTHKAHSRETFARGAVRAALFATGAKPGLYTMRDVLPN